MKNFLRHLFIPHESNNHRAKLLHNEILFFTVIVLFFGSFFLSGFRSRYPSVLGVSSDITAEKLLVLTNQVRVKNGLSPLSMDSELLTAAGEKADDMFLQNYWAHNAPDGKTPWVFIKGAGYNYVYAGENLARGFDSTDSVINAWMASPTHRSNVLSQNYQDVGFAVKKGKLNGEETILVVEELGNRSQNIAQSAPSVPSVPESAIQGASLPKSLISSSAFSLTVDKVVIAVFILVLLSDMIVVGRKKVLRFVGHNLDHIFFFLAFLILINLIIRGVII